MEYKGMKAEDMVRLMLIDGVITLEQAAKYFPEFAVVESEDKWIKQWIIDGLKFYANSIEDPQNLKNAIAWIEKQGKQKNLIAEIKRRIEQYGKEKENAQSLAENMSLGGRIAALEEILTFQKQGEQKSIIQPKFKVGDWVVTPKGVLKIVKIEPMSYNTHQYWTDEGTWFGDGTDAHLWLPKDARDGEVLNYKCDGDEFDSFLLFRAFKPQKNYISSYCRYNGKTKKIYQGEKIFLTDSSHVTPTTNEERGLFFSLIR